MPRVRTVELEAASPDVQAVYTDFHRKMSFPAAPNFIKAQGHSITVVQGTWDLVRNVLVMGKVPRYIKEMLFVAISKDRHCSYCEAAHYACCRMLGVDQKMLNNLVRDVERIDDSMTREIIRFGLKCSRTPGALTDDDYAALRAQGLDECEIVEVIAMAGLAVYANIMADATAVEPDSMFKEIGAPAANAEPLTRV